MTHLGKINVKNTVLLALPQKALYWPEENTLILADVHLGKSTHFRKSGIPIPFDSAIKNYQLLDCLFQEYLPNKVIFLGDLFHSLMNLEWDYFSVWILKYTDIEFILIKGNHDIFPNEPYINAGLQIYEDEYDYHDLLLCHAPVSEPLTDKYVISGHIHPRVMLKGKGNQRLKLPCFIFGQNQALIPAFGTFTGGKLILPDKEDTVFVILDEKIIHIHPTS